MSDLAKEYGGALFELAEDENMTDGILSDIRTAEKMLSENPEYLMFLASPNITIEERKESLNRVFGQANKYVLNYLKMMTELGYAFSICETFGEYKRLYFKKNNIAEATVESAVALSVQQQEKLRIKLEKKTGRKVELHCITDPSVIGGLRITVDGERLEGSIRGKLDEIRTKLAETKL